MHSNKGFSFIPFIISVLLLCGAAALFSVHVDTAKRLAYFYENGTRANAVVTDISSHFSGDVHSPVTYTPVVSYYTPQDGTRVNQATFLTNPNKNKTPVGTKVNIIYDPSNTNEFVAAGNSTTGPLDSYITEAFALFVFGVTCSVLGFFQPYWIRKRILEEQKQGSLEMV